MDEESVTPTLESRYKDACRGNQVLSEDHSCSLSILARRRDVI